MINFVQTSYIKLIWAACIILGLIFHFVPSIDLNVSALFYDQNNGFYLAQNLLVVGIYKFVKIMCIAFLCIALYFAYKKFKTTRSYKMHHYMPVIYVLLVATLGPGFLIHEVVKEVFNRPRPRQIEQFGGTEKFTPAFEISTTDKELYSFVSGHAAAGFMFFSIAFLMRGKVRIQMLIFSTVLGSFFGLIRIMQGGHFLSDVIFSGFLVYFTAYYLEKILKPNSV